MGIPEALFDKLIGESLIKAEAYQKTQWASVFPNAKIPNSYIGILMAVDYKLLRIIISNSEYQLTPQIHEPDILL